MTNQLPGISVVMPLLNQAEFLEESVRSVVQQPLDNLELVVMDGGSEDGGLGRLARLAEEFPGRIRWFSAPDNGPAQAINRAVNLARHELLGWLPADDLYTPGAVRRAVEALSDNPLWQMVYGHADHVDVAGRPLGRYPSLQPDAPIESFAEGCFVCQPTLFMRRATWLQAGGLDESLRASFDFDLWLRLFRKHAGRIGFISETQALSRLHQGGITARYRERVALEGLRVLSTHLGHAPMEWMLTHFEECLAAHPFEAAERDLVEHLYALEAKTERWLTETQRARLRDWIASHRAVQCGSRYWHANAYADGWLPNVAEVRLRAAPIDGSDVVLQLEHRHPLGLPLRLTVTGPGGLAWELVVPINGPFDLTLRVPSGLANQRCVWRLSCDGFAPADCEPGSQDVRRLGVLLHGLKQASPTHG